jgi:hypothetical protein
LIIPIIKAKKETEDQKKQVPKKETFVIKGNETTVKPIQSQKTTESFEKEIEKLDEKLIFGEIDELTYEIEKLKIKNDLETLNQLVYENKINLTKYLEILKKLQLKTPVYSCSSCEENLLGLEKFCPNCGEPIR